MLKILQTQFDQTDKMIQQFSFEHNINPLQRPEDDFMDAASVDYLSDMSSPSVVLQLFKLQLVELADVLMSTFIDRLSLTYGGGAAMLHNFLINHTLHILQPR